MEKIKALSLCNAVLQNFRIEENNTAFKEYYPVLEKDRKDCYLWAYFAAAGMLYHACKAGLELQADYRRLVEGFQYYRSSPLEDGMIKYHSERGSSPGGGHGPCFFDDNIWVARNYLFAYEIFNETEYLEEARRIVTYTYTGWNEELGGLVWNENGLTPQGTVQELERGLSANACCILVNAILYRITGEKSYWDWAMLFYDFCKAIQDPETGIYYNGVHTLLQNGRRTAGEVNRDLWSYNSGSMILADLVIFEITGDKTYLEDAIKAAGAAHEAFLHRDDNTGLAYYKDFTWFLAIFAEGLSALKEYAADVVKPFLRTLEQSMTFAYETYRSPAGLLPHDYVTGWRADVDGITDCQTDPDYDRMLLTHSGTAEISCLLCELRSEQRL